MNITHCHYFSSICVSAQFNRRCFGGICCSQLDLSKLIRNTIDGGILASMCSRLKQLKNRLRLRMKEMKRQQKMKETAKEMKLVRRGVLLCAFDTSSSV